MIKRLLPLVVGVVMSAGVAQAGSLGVAFNDTSAQLTFNQKISDDAWGRSEFVARGLYDNRRDIELVSAGLEVLGPVGRSGFELGAGLRGYYADHDGDHIAGAGLGGLVRFVPPAAPKVKLSGSVYYCPKIFTGMDGERLLETEISAAYHFVPRAAVFVAYTVIKADIENRDEYTLDDTVRVGLSLGF